MDNISRDTFLRKRPKLDQEEYPIRLFLTYHPALNKQIYNILNEIHPSALKSPKLGKVLPTPPRVTYRNAKSIRQHLVRARMKPMEQTPRGVFPCEHSRCQIDDVLKLGDTFSNWNDSSIFKINHRFSCKSECVIYLLTCNICNMKYVGSTITPFNLRFNQYKSNIKL